MQNKKIDANVNNLATGNVFSLLLKFSSTTLASLLLNTVYSLTDALFVSWAVGDDAFGGVSIVFPFVIFQSAVATAVGGGAGSIVSRALGARDNKKAGEATAHAMLVFYVTAIVTTILGFVFMEKILLLFGVTEELLPFAESYFTIILIGNVFSTGFSTIIRAEGKMGYSLLIWVIPVAVNIVLDAIFILVFNWGVIGSAAATVACQFVSFCMSVLFFTKFSKQSFVGVRFSLKKAGEVIVVGLPALIQTVSLSLTTIFLNNVLKQTAGTLGINAFAYASKVMTYLIMPLTAFSQALSPIVGFNFGAKNYDRVKKAALAALALSFIYSVVAFFPTRFFSSAFLRIFTESDEIVSLGGEALSTIAFAFFAFPITNVIGSTLQTTGKKVLSTLVFSMTLLFIVPLSLVLSAKYNLSGVWQAYVFANALSAITSAVVGVFFAKSLERAKA